MSEEGKGSSGFTVTDRRIFADEQGAARVEEPAAPAAPPDGTAPADAGPEPGGPPPSDFYMFVLSLGSSALLHLGELERPGAAGPEKNLPLAKQTIDILGMLQEKTRGNLTPDEAKLMESLVYDLRIRFVEARQKK
jgi:hypothetical protein